jgi:hypothetical protein
MRLGDWHIDSPKMTRTVSYADAIDAYGEPDRCTLRRAPDGIASWTQMGVTLYAATLGYTGPGKNACNDPVHWQVDHVVVTGKRWTTALGLKVGDPTSKLRRLYPKVTHTSGWNAGYWLVTLRTVCLGQCGGAHFLTAPRLVAKTAAGRVTAFDLRIGSQGE